MPDTVSVKTKEICPRCGKKWEAVMNVEPGAERPGDGALSGVGIICPECQKSFVNSTGEPS